jgi:hypothetical protein
MMKPLLAGRFPSLQGACSIFLASGNQPKVFDIMTRCFRSAGESFLEYTKLALAIALVYDQTPPLAWPHYQVSSKILPRKLPDPVDEPRPIRAGNRFKAAGLVAYCGITEPFLKRLKKEGRLELARDALKYTERRLNGNGNGNG